MSEQFITDLETDISNWDSIEQQPPLTEVEVLRLLDKLINQSERSHTNKIEAILYCMLAFFRLQRNLSEKDLFEKLLHRASEVDYSVPVLKQLQDIQLFINLYTKLKETSLEEWSIRETDFLPVKLKKMKEMLNDLKALDITKSDIKRSGSINNGLNASYKEILTEVKNFIIDLEEGIESTENKKSNLQIKHLNERARKISLLSAELYHRIPDILKTTKQTALQELNNMIGLKQVKQYIHQYYHYLKYQKERKELGFHMVDEPGLHMIITGNPGTGKTTLARLIASIYYELGLLETNNVIEVNRSHLVGAYLGQSEENTLNYVKKALGGVLFIDEAYSLKRADQTGNDYGQAVIDTLVTSMTSQEFSQGFAVVLAGYPEEMRQFLWANPGLRSRFPEQNQINLPDFRLEELIQIAENTALNNDYFFTEQAINKFVGLIEKSQVDDSFGNARTIRDLVLKAIFKKGSKKELLSEDHWLSHMRIDSQDLDFMSDEPTEGKPLEKLDKLIGLSNVKNEVKKLSSFVRVQQQRKQNGLPQVPIQLHAVFSGNPGTGKTTVAKIYAQVLKECGLLKRGHLVYASRSELVAGYVGQTAIKTKQKIREALGGVLFIDEAYSLYRGENDFGKEAIDTLVDEMTKHNENLVVILAGYQREMERFIASNPGLESRFKKYLQFKDYNSQELLQITEYQISNYKYTITDDAISYLTEQYSHNKIDGNARFVINLIDETIQFQALRMDSENGDKRKELYQELTKEDFEKAWAIVRGSTNENNKYID